MICNNDMEWGGERLGAGVERCLDFYSAFSHTKEKWKCKVWSISRCDYLRASISYCFVQRETAAKLKRIQHGFQLDSKRCCPVFSPSFPIQTNFPRHETFSLFNEFFLLEAGWRWERLFVTVLFSKFSLRFHVIRVFTKTIGGVANETKFIRELAGSPSPRINYFISRSNNHARKFSSCDFFDDDFQLLITQLEGFQSSLKRFLISHPLVKILSVSLLSLLTFKFDFKYIFLSREVFFTPFPTGNASNPLVK